MKTLEIKVHEIAVDGLPNHEDRTLVGRVAFILDGCVVSGFYIPRGESEEVDEVLDKYDPPLSGVWEGNDTVGHSRLIAGVTHWVEFPAAIGAIEEYGSAKEGMRLRKTRVNA